MSATEFFTQAGKSIMGELNVRARNIKYFWFSF